MSSKQYQKQLEEKKALQEKIDTAKNNEASCVRNFFTAKALVVKAEDSLVTAREDTRKALEALEVYNSTRCLALIDQELKNEEIARFSKCLPALIKKIEAEDTANENKENRYALDNFKQTIQARKSSKLVATNSKTIHQGN